MGVCEGAAFFIGSEEWKEIALVCGSMCYCSQTNMFEILLLFFVAASMARLLESQESQSRLIREYERTREKTASQAMNE